MLILEGAGCLGKTTAAKRIVELCHARGLTQIKYSHMSRPKFPFDFFKDYMGMLNPNAVQDRFHIGGRVWHEESETGFTLQRFAMVDTRIKAMGGMVVVFASRNFGWYRENWEKLISLRNKDNPCHVTFNIDSQCRANEEFVYDWAFNRDSDRYIDEACWLDGPGDYPDDEKLNSWIDEWRKRRELANILNIELPTVIP